MIQVTTMAQQSRSSRLLQTCTNHMPIVKSYNNYNTDNMYNTYNSYNALFRLSSARNSLHLQIPTLNAKDSYGCDN